MLYIGDLCSDIYFPTIRYNILSSYANGYTSLSGRVFNQIDIINVHNMNLNKRVD